MHLEALKRKPMSTYRFKSVTVCAKYMYLITKRKHINKEICFFSSKLSSCSLFLIIIQMLGIKSAMLKFKTEKDWSCAICLSYKAYK